MSPSTSHQKLAGALRKWRAAEQRLYPIALTWPEGFERLTSVVRTVADHLGSVRTVAALVDAYDDRDAVVAAAVGEDLAVLAGLDLDLIAGAGFCIRHRELAAEIRRAETVRRIEDAKARGEDWVVIEETQSPTGVPYPPWRRLEMHLRDGAGLHQWVEEGLAGPEIEFGVELVQLDPESGRWLGGRPARERAVFVDYEEWQDTVERLKHRAGSAEVEGSIERGV